VYPTEKVRRSVELDCYVRAAREVHKSIDRVVTEISLDEDSDVAVMQFTPLRHCSDEEIDLAMEAAATAEAQSVVRLTVAARDGVKKLPPAVEAKAAPKVEAVEVEEVVEEPTKRQSKKAEPPAAKPAKNLADVVSAWSDE
jgi:hypothetical protein